jgi:hypothetical protein
MVNPEATVYHGTSEPLWNKKEPAGTPLYLVNDLGDAANYAYEAASRDEMRGMKPKPIVLRIKISDLKKAGLSLEPDWGWPEATETTTWIESIKAVGSFSVRGDIEKAKKLFHRVSRKYWPES